MLVLFVWCQQCYCTVKFIKNQIHAQDWIIDILTTDYAFCVNGYITNCFCVIQHTWKPVSYDSNSYMNIETQYMASPPHDSCYDITIMCFVFINDEPKTNYYSVGALDQYYN